MFTTTTMVWNCGSSKQPVCCLHVNKRTRCFFMISQLHCYGNELRWIAWSGDEDNYIYRGWTRSWAARAPCVLLPQQVCEGQSPRSPQPLYPVIFNLLPGLRKTSSGSVLKPRGNGLSFLRKNLTLASSAFTLQSHSVENTLNYSQYVHQTFFKSTFL